MYGRTTNPESKPDSSNVRREINPNKFVDATVRNLIAHEAHEGVRSFIIVRQEILIRARSRGRGCFGVGSSARDNRQRLGRRHDPHAVEALQIEQMRVPRHNQICLSRQRTSEHMVIIRVV